MKEPPLKVVTVLEATDFIHRTVGLAVKGGYRGRDVGIEAKSFTFKKPNVWHVVDQYCKGFGLEFEDLYKRADPRAPLRWTTLGNVRVFTRPMILSRGMPVSVYVGIRRQLAESSYSVSLGDVRWKELDVPLKKQKGELYVLPKSVVGKEAPSFTLKATIIVRLESGKKLVVPFEITELDLKE